MNIVSFTDKQGSAIDRLARMTAKRLPHININVLPFHPKRPDAVQIEDARKALEWADLVDAQYWKTAVAIRKLFPELAKKKKWILTHQNEHNIEGDWEWKHMQWDALVAKNGWQKERLEAQGYKVVLIKHAVEFDSFNFISELTHEKVVGYVGQIKKVKGVRELKQACDELGYRLMVVGKPSEAGYWQELDKNGLEVHTDIPDGDIGALYHRMRVYCANSDDGTESGTMPILEAMASGIPVVTRRIGHVRDFGQHEKNLYIRKGVYTDIEDLKNALKMVMENDDIAGELRENAWRTVRQYHPDIQAREYEKMFRKMLYPGQVPVSVIMPTCQRLDVLLTNLVSLNDQTYKNFEVMVINDGSDDLPTQLSFPEFSFPVRWLSTEKKDSSYGLAKARNIGVTEAIGDIIVLCDDRLKMHPGAIAAFVKKLHSYDSKKVWLWGSKGIFKSFVENFSAVWRRSLIDGGMFCERIDRYGGMTQEVSGRYAAQGFRFEWCAEALAEPIMGTHSKAKHREDIITSKIRLYKMGYQ